MDELTVLTHLAPEDRARPALVTDDRVWSFAELAARAAGMANRFESIGVRAGDRVALVAAPTPEVFVAIHALVAMGATLVPIHPRLTPAEVHVTLDVARTQHVLEARDIELPPAEVAAGAGAGAQARWSLEGNETRGASGERAHVGSAAPFAIVSTSGTTGRPKGAVLSRGAIVHSADASARNLGWNEDDRWLLAMPLAHVGGLSILTRCLVARRAVVLLPRFEPALVLEAIEKHRVTLLSVVPTMLRALLEVDARGVLARPRVVLLGGAAAPAALLDLCAERGVRALTTYGLTEACSQVTAQAPRDPAVRLGGSGAPLAGFELRIVGDDGSPLAPAAIAPAGAAGPDGAARPDGAVGLASETGRIHIRGPALFDGYLAPDGSLDAARSADGFFDTGDVGELDERGHLHVHVRRTDLIVTGGENVYPAEVEQALEGIPGVRRALVLGVPDERWGQVVAAVIEADTDSAPHADALLDVVSRSLAAHKRPRRYAIVDRLPLTTSGKVDRKDALARFVALLRPLARAGS